MELSIIVRLFLLICILVLAAYVLIRMIKLRKKHEQLRNVNSELMENCEFQKKKIETLVAKFIDSRKRFVNLETKGTQQKKRIEELTAENKKLKKQLKA